MAFFEELFPRRISRGAQGGPVFATGGTEQPNGFRTTQRKRMWPLHEWEVGHVLRTNADFEELRAWFYVVCGRFEGFRFEDPADHLVTRPQSSLTLITGSTWQLNRTYTVGARVFARPIFKPRAGVVIYDAGGSALTATVDTTTGIATVTGAPVTWSGSFDVPVAFADDAAVFSLLGSPQMYMQWKSIRLREIRENFSA